MGNIELKIASQRSRSQMLVLGWDSHIKAMSQIFIYRFNSPTSIPNLSPRDGEQFGFQSEA